MLATMAAILFSWSLLIIAFSGLGYAVLRICRFEQEEDRFFYAFWIGFCVVLFFLQLWHFALPVNDRALYLLLLIGGCCFLISFREFASDTAKFFEKYQLLLIIGLALFASNRALAPIKLFDAGLYHLSVILWDSSFPIVRGLGNLMDRFGMNNSYFLYHSLLDPFPIVRSFHVANGVLLFMLLLQMISSFFRIAKQEGRTVDWFLLILLPATFGQLLDHAEDTSTDLAVYVMSALIAIRLCHSLFSDQTNRQKIFDLFFVSLVAATAVSIKISAAVFGFMAIAIILLRFRRGYLWMIPALGILIVWICGNILLTGYPLYPSLAFSAHVDWTMPSRTVLNFEQWVRISNRDPHGDPIAVLKTWSWLDAWIGTLFERKNLFEIVLPLVLFVVGLIVVKKDRRTIWLVLPAILSSLYWFRAPAVRFAGACFWWMVAGVFAPILQRSRIEIKYLCLVLITAGLVVSRVYFAPVVVRTAPIFHYPATLGRFVTDSGLTVYVPVERNSCWESPIPCTSMPDRSLRLLREDDPGGGFATAP